MDEIENDKYYVVLNDEGFVIRHHHKIPEAVKDLDWIEIPVPSAQLNTADVENAYYCNTDGTITVTPRSECNEFNKVLVKEVRVEDVSKVLVTTSTGKVFDGDEASQDRMLRAVSIAAISGQTTTNWKLADNTIVEVTLDELKEALVLAGQEMSRIWLEQ